MRLLVVIHRWLGIPFCILFAMWFATGMVMHFVPFPSLSEAERIAGLAPIEARAVAKLQNGPGAALRTSGLGDAARVRLLQRADGFVYVVADAARLVALHADMTPAAVGSESLALAIAGDYAGRRGLPGIHPALAALAPYDQWTVPNGFDPHRPLYRVALNDAEGTELYVSSVTGEVVLDTTARERGWNYAGSVLHWIYPTILRRDWALWNITVWWLSLVAVIAAATGVMLGVLRLRRVRGRLRSPYRRWHAWHHWLGLACMVFVMTWIVSGWFSMDHGRLFSEGRVTEDEAAKIAGTPAWTAVPAAGSASAAAPVLEIEWFPLGGDIYRRERSGLGTQRLSLASSTAAEAGDGVVADAPVLPAARVDAVMRRLAPACAPARVVPPDDPYPQASAVTDAPVYRAACGDVWYQFDGATGAVLEKLDPSRRAYRWAYSALHTFDLPALLARPGLRTALILALCALGLVFSITSIVIGWRRLKLKAHQVAHG